MNWTPATCGTPATASTPNLYSRQSQMLSAVAHSTTDAPDAEGSNPSTHPNETKAYNGRVDFSLQAL